VAKATLSFHRSATFPQRIDEPFGEVAAVASVARGADADLVAPWTAWHEIRLHVDGARAGDKPGVCVSVRP
jgi:hypothetical protein